MAQNQFKLPAEEDALSKYRDEFVIPTNRSMKASRVPQSLRESRQAPRATPNSEVVVVDETCTYLCGNSLGVLPKRSRQLVQEELEVWGTR